MQLPRLDIHNTFAQLGISQHRATIEMRQPMADVQIRQPLPEVKLHKTKGKLEIDQTEAFADANLKHPYRVIREYAQKARQKLLQNLAKEAAEGDRLMKIENQSKSVIPQIAKENSETPPKEIGLGFVPSSAEKVKFYYQPSKIDIEVMKGNLSVNITPKQPMIKYKRGDLQIYLKQKPSITFTAVGTKVDQIL